MSHWFIFSLWATLLMSCGIVKSTPNPMVNAGIEIADKYYPPDNFLEERIEAGIESLTGVDVDLSPATPEK